jgi:hypothetical protein
LALPCAIRKIVTSPSCEMSNMMQSRLRCPKDLNGALFSQGRQGRACSARQASVSALASGQGLFVFLPARQPADHDLERSV